MVVQHWTSRGWVFKSRPQGDLPDDARDLVVQRDKERFIVNVAGMTERMARIIAAAWNNSGGAGPAGRPMLKLCETEEILRPASEAEFWASLEAASRCDWGRGTIKVEGKECFVDLC